MSLVGFVRARRLRRSLEEQREFYGRDWTVAQSDAWQLAEFNRLWSDFSPRVPRYRRLREAGSLPAQFSSWAEFAERMPASERGELQADVAAFVDPVRPPDLWRATGGSTARPLRTPAWRDELSHHSADFWFARSWFGIAPSDRLFLLWGHAHLLGSGVRGRIAALERRTLDRLLGYRRFSAYDLGEAALRRAAEAMLDFRPAYVLGYAAALDRLARVNRAERSALRALRLKAVIATGESFPLPSSKDLVAEVFGCPVVMEYGAVETGALAHQRPSGEFAVFWRHYRLEGEAVAGGEGAREILVTSLYPRCLPLVRYRIGDLVRGGLEVARAFAHLVGRSGDVIRLGDGRQIHSEAVAHVLRDIEGIEAYQVVQREDAPAALSYTGSPLAAVDEAEVRRRLGRIDPELAGMTLEHRASASRTVAGKTPRVSREGRP